MPSDDMSPLVHIGRRCGAGQYCWDCKKTLCRAGEDTIHYASSYAWHTSCPSCGAAARSEFTTEAGEDEEPHIYERGIGDRKIPLRRRGVGSACSFTWAQDPKMVYAICAARPDEQIIKDEYGRPLTGEEFLEVLRNCPIQFTDSIGKEFC
jgi:hypothetical protein